MPNSVRYQFFQRFVVPARKAYLWCTDYDSKDHLLMGKENAKRQVTHFTDATIILTDTFETESGSVEKQKLVQLYPDRLSWIATHLTGPNKYSQFIYEVSAENGKTSRLKFTALHLEYERATMDKANSKALAAKLRKEDAEGWKLLAKAMAKELGK